MPYYALLCLYLEVSWAPSTPPPSTPQHVLILLILPESTESPYDNHIMFSHNHNNSDIPYILSTFLSSRLGSWFQSPSTQLFICSHHLHRWRENKEGILWRNLARPSRENRGMGYDGYILAPLNRENRETEETEKTRTSLLLFLVTTRLSPSSLTMFAISKPLFFSAIHTCFLSENVSAASGVSARRNSILSGARDVVLLGWLLGWLVGWLVGWLLGCC